MREETLTDNDIEIHLNYYKMNAASNYKEILKKSVKTLNRINNMDFLIFIWGEKRKKWKLKNQLFECEWWQI